MIKDGHLIRTFTGYARILLDEHGNQIGARGASQDEVDREGLSDEEKDCLPLLTLGGHIIGSKEAG